MVKLSLTSYPRFGEIAGHDMAPRQRLEYLRDFLRGRKLPKGLWDMASIRVEPECGTAGCAWGWWCHLNGTGPQQAYDTFDSESAHAEFGISSNEFCEIFAGDLSASPHEVADKIDIVLSGGTLDEEGRF